MKTLFVFGIAVWLLASGSAIGQGVLHGGDAIISRTEMVCVVIHQEGFVRNPTPDQIAKGMLIPCDEKTDDIAALNYYLAHGGH